MKAQRFIGSISRFSTFLVDNARSAGNGVQFERETYKARHKPAPRKKAPTAKNKEKASQ
jgi:hypothetical protein